MIAGLITPLRTDAARLEDDPTPPPESPPQATETATIPAPMEAPATATDVPMQATAASDGSAKPIQVGEIYATKREISYLKEASWEQSIHKPDAWYIKVHFAKADLLPGDTLVVRDPQGRDVFTYPGSLSTTDGSSGFWAISVLGDTARISLLHRSEIAIEASQVSQLGVLVDKYAAGYPEAQIEELLGSGRTESTCTAENRQNAVCYETSHPTPYSKSNAVAGMLINGGSWCTTWRVSSANRMFTNNHCVASQSDVSNSEMWFNYRRSNCAGTTDAVRTVVTGNTLLETNVNYDFSLYSVNSFDTLSTFGYFDLDARTPIQDEQIYIAQQGAYIGQTWSYYRQLGIVDDMSSGSVCRINSPIRTGEVANSDTGYYCDTTGGSSGSPVISYSSNKVIALHHWGTGRSDTYCNTTYMNQGVRMDLIYPLVSAQLPPLPATAQYPNSSVGSPTPVMRWTQVSAATGYTLYVYTSANAVVFSGAVSPTCDGSVCRYTYSAGGLTAGSYKWAVRASNAVGYSSTSNWLEFSAATPPAPTAQYPSGAVGSSTPVIKWSQVSGATGYNLYVYTSTNVKVFSGAVTPTCDGTSCRYTYSAGLAQGDYKWAVKSKNAFGYSATSNWLNINVAPPPAPTALSPSGNTVSSPTFTWTKVSVATGYNLYVYTSANVKVFAGAVTPTCDSANCTFASSLGLGAGEYKFGVRATNALGSSVTSNWLNFTVPVASVPTTPVALSPSGNTVSSPTFRWTKSADAAAYHLYIYTSANSLIFAGSVAFTCDATACEHTSALGLASGNYKFGIKARNASGFSPTSNWLSFLVST